MFVHHSQGQMTWGVVLIAVFGGMPKTASAQAPAVTVQQPVLGVTGVATTVSVPDHGRAVLGSVSRGATGRTTAGFGLKNRGRFSESSHTGISTRVFIHDFEEMDRAALAEHPAGASNRISGATGRLASGGANLSPRAAHAWKTLEGKK